ncbi:hypothetical protein [Acinetobacter pittii]|nr:hypothetical protein [Acinetobacter pittii]
MVAVASVTKRAIFSDAIRFTDLKIIVSSKEKKAALNTVAKTATKSLQ